MKTDLVPAEPVSLEEPVDRGSTGRDPGGSIGRRSTGRDPGGSVGRDHEG